MSRQQPPRLLERASEGAETFPIVVGDDNGDDNLKIPEGSKLGDDDCLNLPKNLTSSRCLESAGSESDSHESAQCHPRSVCDVEAQRCSRGQWHSWQLHGTMLCRTHIGHMRV